jgi:hypothetical protein
VRKSSSSSSSSQSRSASVSIKRDETTSQRESDVKTAKHNVKSIKKQQKSSKPASPARKAPAGSQAGKTSQAPVTEVFYMEEEKELMNEAKNIVYKNRDDFQRRYIDRMNAVHGSYNGT